MRHLNENLKLKNSFINPPKAIKVTLLIRGNPSSSQKITELLDNNKKINIPIKRSKYGHTLGT